MRDEYFIFLHFTPNNIAFAFFSLAPQHRRLKAVFLLGGDAHIREAAFGRIQKDGTDERLRYLVQREARRKQRHRHALRRRLIAEQIIGQCALKARVEPDIKQPLHYIAQLCVHISLRLCERHIRRAARLPFHIFSHIEIQRYLARDQHGQKHRRHQQRKLYPEARVAVSTQQPFHSNPPGTKRKIPFILALHSKARKPPGRFCAAFLYKYTILPRQMPKREPLGMVLFRRLGFVFYLAVSCLSGSKLG